MEERRSASRVAREARRVQRHFLRRVIDLAMAAFGFVAALAWNEAIQATLDRYIPRGSGVIHLFLYAILVTLAAVLFTMYLGSVAGRLNLDEEDRHAQD